MKAAMTPTFGLSRQSYCQLSVFYTEWSLQSSLLSQGRSPSITYCHKDGPFQYPLCVSRVNIRFTAFCFTFLPDFRDPRLPIPCVLRHTSCQSSSSCIGRCAGQSRLLLFVSLFCQIFMIHGYALSPAYSCTPAI